MIFWRSKWECGIYAVVFLLAALVAFILNGGTLEGILVVLYLFISVTNLLMWIYKTYKMPDTSSFFSGSKWTNGLYGLFFLGVALILIFTEGAGLTSAAVQLSLLFGGVEALLFLIRLITQDKPKFLKHYIKKD